MNITEGYTYLGMNLFILIFIFAYLVWILPRDIHTLGWTYLYWYLYLHIWCEYYRGTYISWDEPIYIDIYICLSSVHITEGHTCLGMNIFILIFIFAYLLWILPWDIHILGWTYLYWYIYICISSMNITERQSYLGMNLFILIFMFAYLVWILQGDMHILGWTYLYWYLHLHI